MHRSLAVIALSGAALAGCSSGGSPQTPVVTSNNASSTSLAQRSAAGVVRAGNAQHALPERLANAAALFEAHAQAPTSRTLAQNVNPAGSANTTTADPPVPRPHTRPCIVPLFSGVQFADYAPKPFQFAPPAACPGPWAKVVLELNLGVSAGRQFDRTATVGFAGTTIFFGTTAEPSASVARSWHVERDVTDESALFHTAQNGQISIGNTVNSTYTGVLTGAGQLDFYPPGPLEPAPRVADIVVPIADGNGNPLQVATTGSSATANFSPPRTVERALLDVVSQSQSADEFWYTCFPNDLAAQLNNCGNTAFRESEVALDGKPAGVAPVYPWIYTGGIDPYLWRPIPGVQTLDFTPYRVDLTPFAATLDDGTAHTVGISVYNADNYFSVAGTLLLYLDHGARGPLTGGLDSDDIAATPPENVTEGGSFDAAGIGQGTIDTTSRRTLHLRGHLDTSHGRVDTEVTQSLAFVQHQSVISSATGFTQNITQDTKIDSRTRTNGFGLPLEREAAFDWPLTLNYAFTVNSDGTQSQTTTVDQRYSLRDSGLFDFPQLAISDIVTSADTLNFDSAGTFTGTSGNSSAQIYRAFGGGYGCYGRKVTSAAGLVASDAPAACLGNDAPARD